MKIFLGVMFALLTLVACAAPTPRPLKVLAAETFLADIGQNVAGDRLQIEALLPLDADPHSFEPTPNDVRRVADCTVLIVNGAGFEEFLNRILANAGGNRQVIDASAGLTSRKPTANEILDADRPGDPHFWLDPSNVVKYVENIRDALAQVDPAGATTYKSNADAYIANLKQLDQAIAEQVKTVPAERRKIVTNHESFGYFADRYGFQIIGTIVPSVSTGAAPSAQQIARLIDQIRQSGTRVIFLEAGANPQLAKQIAQETGVRIVTNLYTHSLTAPNGVAPTYIEMMKHNVKTIVDALK